MLARGPDIPSAVRPRAAPGATSLSNWCLARCSVQTCDLAITRSGYRTVLVMTEYRLPKGQPLPTASRACQGLAD